MNHLAPALGKPYIHRAEQEYASPLMENKQIQPHHNTFQPPPRFALTENEARERRGNLESNPLLRTTTLKVAQNLYPSIITPTPSSHQKCYAHLQQVCLCIGQLTKSQKQKNCLLGLLCPLFLHDLKVFRSNLFVPAYHNQMNEPWKITPLKCLCPHIAEVRLGNFSSNRATILGG